MVLYVGLYGAICGAVWCYMWGCMVLYVGLYGAICRAVWCYM